MQSVMILASSDNSEMNQILTSVVSTSSIKWKKGNDGFVANLMIMISSLEVGCSLLNFLSRFRIIKDGSSIIYRDFLNQNCFW